MKTFAKYSVITREAQSRAECVKSRLANTEDIMVLLMTERCILTEYILFHLAVLAPKCVLKIVRIQRDIAKGIRGV